MKIIFTIAIFLAFTPILLAKDNFDLSYIWDDIVWCGPHMDKALVCHSGNGKKYVEICVSINSLKAGHLTLESGVTRLHGDDYFGSCDSPTPENKISIYPCNAGIKRRELNRQTTVIGDSTSQYGNYNDYISAEITSLTSSPADNSYDDYNYTNISVNGGRGVYNTITSTPFTTLLNTDALTFILSSETYGTNYFVDWCITQTNPVDSKLDVIVNTTANRYIRSSNLITKFELHCGPDANSTSRLTNYSYEQMQTTINIRNITVPASSHCIWRQRFIEATESIRPNSGEKVVITAELNLY
ncbi:MAG: hypothetical protein KAG61_05690 [Bacteriovoracaceae bacterium]|nr:hypothetical protein [Bacteriovoracaceae bacterium]